MPSAGDVFNHGGADFLGTIFGGMAWSAYAVLFFWFLTLQHKAEPDQKNNSRRITYALMALFCIATLNFAVDLGQGYLLQVDGADPTLTAAWRLAIGSTVLLAIVDFLSQIILIYRAWFVWNKNYYVVSPVAFLAFVSLVLQMAGAGLYGTVSGGAVISSNAGPMFHTAVPLQTTSLSLSMAVNTLVTGLIATKIWVQSGQIRIIRAGGKKDKTFNRAITLVIESGLINFVVQLIFLVLNALELPAFSLMATCAVHFYGITPTLLGIRVITGKSIETRMEATHSLAFASAGPAGTIASIETGQQSKGPVFEFASKEAIIVGKEMA